MKRTILSCALVFFILLAPLILFAVDFPKISHPVPIKIYVTMTKDGMTPLNRQMMENFKKKLISRGFEISEESDFCFFLDAKSIAGNGNNLVAISTFAQHSLPSKIVQFCAEEEVFYKLLDNDSQKKYPQNGKFVREYVTSEMLKQYGRIIFNDLSIVSKENLDQACSDILERFIQKTNYQFHFFPQK